MSDDEDGLAARRRHLEAQAAAQREQLGSMVRSVDSRLRGYDRNVATAQQFIRKPAVLIGGAALLVLIGPRRIVKMAAPAALAVAAVRRLLRYIR